MNRLRIVFAGTPEFGLPSLEALLQSPHELIAVYTQPDRPSGRGRKLQASAVKQWALQSGVPVYQPANFKDATAVEQLAALSPDVMVVIAYGLILPELILKLPKFGCINVHASLLPRWRGASPIQQAILHGDHESGITIMQMDMGMDTGHVIKKAAIALNPEETAGSLHDKLSLLAVDPLLATLNGLPHTLAEAQAQNPQLATYAPKIRKEEAKINWHQPAIHIERQIRAFNPWPIAFTHMGETTIRIHKAKINPVTSDEIPGTIIDISRNAILVATMHESIAIEKLQFPGGKVLSISEWFNSSRQQLSVNTVFQ
ncbi:methionyl-tRNA formyltransferase [Legionella israelensis]|uniref:Methionyl-tRNA formyltransferase n=1 Tax=Legionella israelensis TaxID=454 RepID=A0AAX1EIL9_9GAMM|nr:methionyl-tRNA formyltransferase [Legionella israelensis]QBR84893.1 methionyl-tRNA formyltransferase [Legionella israelensis]